MGVLGFVQNVQGGAGECAGHEGDKVRASLGLPFEYRVEGTMWDYLRLFAF